MILHPDDEPKLAVSEHADLAGNPPMKKRHKIMMFFSGLVVLTGVLVVIYFIFLANTSTKGTVTLVKPSSGSQKPAGDLALKGTYIRFSYGSTYISQNTQVTVPNALEQHVLLSNGFEGKQIAVVVSRLVEGSLDEYASYKFRSVHPEDYTEKPLKVIGSTGAIMEKHDGSEVTAFVVKRDMITSISITANSASSNHADLEPEMTKLLKSFSWVQ